MKDQFHRILELVRRTGDTLIVTDPDGEKVFVVMDLDQYEALLDLSAVYEEDQAEESQPDVWHTMKPAGVEGETWDMDQMDAGELADLEDQYRQFVEKKTPETIQDEKEPKKEENKPDSDQFGEEQFYLEPIE
ncbi:hypothetical protein HZA85_00195 [Candidatus Uhrbacteria bacterium]|nr:hypothetical protein [Candidatus Uhrbacteria bacterium]